MIGQHFGHAGIHAGFGQIGDKFMRIKSQIAHLLFPVFIVEKIIA